MLIPASYQPLPDVSTCHNESLVFGGVIAQCANSSAMLTHVKCRARAHYPIMHTTYINATAPTIGVMGADLLGSVGSFKRDKGYTESNSFFYASSPLSEYLGIDLKVSATLFDSAEPKVTLVLHRESTGAIIDNGIEFNHIDLNVQAINQQAQSSRASTLYDISANAPTNTTPDKPRPLYVPNSDRGEVLYISATTTACILRSITIYDLYDPEVSA